MTKTVKERIEKPKKKSAEKEKKAAEKAARQAELAAQQAASQDVRPELMNRSCVPNLR